MATGHLDPGYADPVSRFQRASKALYTGTARPGAQNLRDFMNIRADPMSLEDIRKRAREVWLQKDANQTSYQDHFQERFSAMDEQTPNRPTSASRRNNPHPPMVFLTTRLHHCPGFNNPDTTMGKDVYQVDGSQPPYIQSNRAQARHKYIGTVSHSATHQYRQEKELEDLNITDPVERQVAEARYKVGSPQERRILLAQLRDKKPDRQLDIRGILEASNRPTTVPSLHRYLRESGYDEYNQIQSINNNYGIPTADIVTRRFDDIDNYGKLNKYQHRSKRGDFLLHPQWPPSIPHHRLNGLSSVDVPYMPGRR